MLKALLMVWQYGGCELTYARLGFDLFQCLVHASHLGQTGPPKKCIVFVPKMLTFVSEKVDETRAGVWFGNVALELKVEKVVYRSGD